MVVELQGELNSDLENELCVVMLDTLWSFELPLS
jgi:hypothetical protein